MGRKLTLNSVAAEIKDWRRTKPKRSKMPTYIFDLINQIKHDYPLQEITETLQLNSYQIGKLKKGLHPPDNFVELPIATTPASAAIICKFSKPNGISLKVTVDEAQLLPLLNQFLCYS